MQIAGASSPERCALRAYVKRVCTRRKRVRGRADGRIVKGRVGGQDRRQGFAALRKGRTMNTLAEKNRTWARTHHGTRRIEAGGAGGDWRVRLLADLCAGPEGTKLRRLVNERNARSHADANNSTHRQTRTSPSSCARAIGALRRLRAIRTAAPSETARHELRIRFSLDRVDESL